VVLLIDQEEKGVTGAKDRVLPGDGENKEGDSTLRKTGWSE